MSFLANFFDSLIGWKAVGAAALLLASGLLSVRAEELTPSATVPANSAERAQLVLDETWKLVAELHYQADFDQRYRQSLYERFQPEIRQAANDEEIADRINRMLRETGDSHIALLPPSSRAAQKALRAVSSDEPAETSGGENDEDATPLNFRREKVSRLPFDPELTVLAVDEAIVVNWLAPESPAWKAGIRPGYKILAVDDVEIKPAEHSEAPWGLMVRALLNSGSITRPLHLRADTGNGEEQNFSFKRRLARRSSLFELGMIKMVSNYRARKLDNGIGYVMFDAFIPEVILQFRQSLTGPLAGSRGLIFDLRGNPGGVIMIASWLAAWCVPEEIPMVKMTISQTELFEKSSPQPGAFAGPIAILVDRESCSTSEIFAAALQDAGKAIVIGSPTPGKCLPSNFFELPETGFRLQTVTGDCHRPSGARLEGVGVTPDLISTYRNGRDEALELAEKQLLEQLNQQSPLNDLNSNAKGERK